MVVIRGRGWEDGERWMKRVKKWKLAVTGKKRTPMKNLQLTSFLIIVKD